VNAGTALRDKLDLPGKFFHPRPVRIRTFARSAGFGAVMFAALFPMRTEANEIAILFSVGDVAVSEVDTTFGWAFSLSEPLTVTDLGVAVASLSAWSRIIL
jgi:hypothetical protein